MSILTPEAKVKQFVKKTMLSAFPGIFYYSPPGGAFGKAGMPDHIYLWQTILVAIEVKADKGVLSALQKKTLNDLSAQGAISAVVYGRDIDKMNMIIAKIKSEAIRRGSQNTV